MSENSAKKVYLDHAATTPTDARVVDEMHACLHEWGNPSSLHTLGISAKEHLNAYRQRLANLVNAAPEELIFTSGGTEANNLALKGMAFMHKERGNHIIVSAVEHDCILNSCKWLATQGFFVTYIPVDRQGFVDVERLEKCINPKTLLVSVMHANNEIGTIQPIREIGAICEARGVAFHTDACQSFGKIPIDVQRDHLSMMSLNAHKIYGPKGIGCLYVKSGTKLTPLLHGGGQEFGLRSTTENLVSIAGFVKAAELCIAEQEAENKRLTALRNGVIETLSRHFEGFYLNGDAEKRLPNNLNFAISGLEGDTIRLMLLLDEQGFALSTGSACSNNDTTKSASHVLQAIGRDQFQSRGAIRVGLGRHNTEEEVKAFTDCFVEQVHILKPIFN